MIEPAWCMLDCRSIQTPPPGDDGEPGSPILVIVGGLSTQTPTALVPILFKYQIPFIPNNMQHRRPEENNMHHLENYFESSMLIKYNKKNDSWHWNIVPALYFIMKSDVQSTLLHTVLMVVCGALYWPWLVDVRQADQYQIFHTDWIQTLLEDLSM